MKAYDNKTRQNLTFFVAFVGGVVTSRVASICGDIWFFVSAAVVIVVYELMLRVFRDDDKMDQKEEEAFAGLKRIGDELQELRTQKDQKGRNDSSSKAR